MTEDSNSYILTVSCPDTIGIVAAISGFLRDKNFFVEETSHYGDRDTGMFFSRNRFTTTESACTEDEFRSGFAEIAKEFDMQWEIHDSARIPRVVIMVSKHEHCLNDLLYRYRTGGLCMEVPAIVSNHEDLRHLAEWHGIPFHYVRVDSNTKSDAERQLMQIFDDVNADLLILARYMQILSDDLCNRLAGRAINIHHSFLPGFKGARPYHKAHERGVKLIGATAHYVTADLDEGPIIEQVVERVDHTFDADDLVAVGRDAENITLARAVKYHLEHRVFVNGKRTVVFR